MSIRLSVVLAASMFWASAANAQPTASAPATLLGAFQDDYGIRYVVSDSLIQQGSRLRYHVLSWHPVEHYLIARNDHKNPADGGLYTRIDWVMLTDMAPYSWAYCLTAYRAPTPDSARATPAGDRANPRTGCNGFPFSRMAPVSAGASPPETKGRGATPTANRPQRVGRGLPHVPACSPHNHCALSHRPATFRAARLRAPRQFGATHVFHPPLHHSFLYDTASADR